jgi:ATP-dependent HslUV protease ATP-binding subunit HslU
VAIAMVRQQYRDDVSKKALIAAKERVLQALVGENASEDTKKKFLAKLEKGAIDDKEVDIEVQDNPIPGGSTVDIPGMPGGQMGVVNIGDILGKAIGGARTKTKTMTVAEAMELITTEESDKLIDEEKIIQDALKSVENNGIVFIDELDKIATRVDGPRGSEVNREGVQRDLLPLIEGTNVSTKYGTIKTDHILFISSGAFHLASPADLLPELQGRLPIRVELNALSQEDMVRILKEPESSLLKQYQALLEAEGVKLTFKENAIAAIAQVAAEVNKSIENIGARRLHTIMEKLLEDISYNTPDAANNNKVTIDDKYVKSQLSNFADNMDLSKFVL